MGMSKQTAALKLALPDRRVVTAAGDPEDYINSGWNECLDAIRKALDKQCVCGEPDTPGTHRTDGPCLAEQPAQQREPVGYWQGKFSEDGGATLYEVPQVSFFGRTYPNIPLYTSPPASKPWVHATTWRGLTDVEWMNIVNKDHAWFGQRPEDVAHEVAALVEAKLREKNEHREKNHG